MDEYVLSQANSLNGKMVMIYGTVGLFRYDGWDVFSIKNEFGCERFDVDHVYYVYELLRAQVLYDAREERAIISGTDLHDLFRLINYGDPSPSGDMLISIDVLRNLAREVPFYREFITDALKERKSV